jgi:hypothetical protein
MIRTFIHSQQLLSNFFITNYITPNFFHIDIDNLCDLKQIEKKTFDGYFYFKKPTNTTTNLQAQEQKVIFLTHINKRNYSNIKPKIFTMD